MMGQLTCLGRHTVTGTLCATGHQFDDWTADYRFYSQSRFCDESLFESLTDTVCEMLEPGQPLVAAIDDSFLRKTGKKTPGTKYQRDPLGPPFHTNLVLGQRMLQISAAIPNPDNSAEMVPIDFIQAPLPQKPRKTASEEVKQAYEKERKDCNINIYGANQIQKLRNRVDSDRQIILAADNRFTTSTVLARLPEGVTFVGRVRKPVQCQKQSGKSMMIKKQGSLHHGLSTSLECNFGDPLLTYTIFGTSRNRYHETRSPIYSSTH
jgi:hypothetical protein